MTVVDVWGGWADEARTRPWQADTMVSLYSVGKAIVATLALRLVDEGRLDLDAPVADVWPEFAAGGKADITVAEALSHRARVPGIRTPLVDDDLADWSRMTEALASTPAWAPAHCYHTNTYGHLVGEIVRRVTGELPGAVLRRLVDDLG
ncbi:MAG: serine hydrolase domain-containing protein, partial [Acidimicrobiales bacterium]